MRLETSREESAVNVERSRDGQGKPGGWRSGLKGLSEVSEVSASTV
jgi:hypothetical protein